MSWFKKKEESKAADADDSDTEEQKEKSSISGNVEIELTKISSSIEALNEVRKANAEQFTRMSEQIGELRGSLMDSNKSISIIEVASTKAIDMVTSVQPDKLMIEVRRVDAKIEGLRAVMEANEAIMKDIMKELKEMRAQMNFYKGVDQVVKMNNEIKDEMINIKKTEGLIGKHADRVETIFVEVEKKFYDFEKFNETVKELNRQVSKIGSDFDKVRVTMEEKADKKEFVKLVDKFSDFEKHTTNILKLLDQKSRTTVVELNGMFDQLKKQLEKRYDTKIEVKPLADESTEATDSVGKDSKTEVKTETKAADEAKTSGTEVKDVADTKTETTAPKDETKDAKTENKDDKKETKDKPEDAKSKKGLFGAFKK